MFVDTTRIAVALTPEEIEAIEDEELRGKQSPANVIYIRPKMGVEIKNKVQDALARIGLDDKGSAAIGMAMGEYEIALFVHNVLEWDGPAFKLPGGPKVACTADNIKRLDPDEPLVQKALEEIAKRNPLGGRSTARKSMSVTAPGSAANGSTP